MFSRPRYLPIEHGPHDAVEGALGDEVVHVDRGRLTDAVGSVFSLLDVAGVPVELGKHHVAGGGEGQSLERARKHTHTRTQAHSEENYLK